MPEKGLQITWGIYSGVIIQRRKHLTVPESVGSVASARQRVEELKRQYSATGPWTLGYVTLIKSNGETESLYQNSAWITRQSQN